MKISILASGSKANSTFIDTNENRILIDIGAPALYIETKLHELGIEPNTINCIFLTHTHADHINGLRVFLKRYNPTVYLSEKMYNELSPKIALNNYVIFDEEIILNSLKITSFKTSHDCDDSNGYIFTMNHKSIVFITDTGYINVKHHQKLKNKTLYVMESNHDIELLMNGSYPHYLKQRILSDHGHLSNKDSAQYLSLFVGNKTKGIILIHLSEKNNNPKVALTTLQTTLSNNNIAIDKIIIAKQNEKTEMIEI